MKWVVVVTESQSPRKALGPFATQEAALAVAYGWQMTHGGPSGQSAYAFPLEKP